MSIDGFNILTHVFIVHLAYLRMYGNCVIIAIVEKRLLWSGSRYYLLKGGYTVAKSRTSAAVKNRYAAKAYDRVALIVPKGRKEDIEAFAKEKGLSINGYIGELIREDMRLSEEAWKAAPEEGEGL